MNKGQGIGDRLKTEYHRYPALIPAYSHMHKKKPKKVNNLENVYTRAEHTLTWQSKSDKYDPETAQYYVVYRFAKGAKEDLDNPASIVAITRRTSYTLPYEGGSNEYKYVVTAVDAFHNESKGRSKKVKL